MACGQFADVASIPGQADGLLARSNPAREERESTRYFVQSASQLPPENGLGLLAGGGQPVRVIAANVASLSLALTNLKAIPLVMVAFKEIKVPFPQRRWLGI